MNVQVQNPVFRPSFGPQNGGPRGARPRSCVRCASMTSSPPCWALSSSLGGVLRVRITPSPLPCCANGCGLVPAGSAGSVSCLFRLRLAYRCAGKGFNSMHASRPECAVVLRTASFFLCCCVCLLSRCPLPVWIGGRVLVRGCGGLSVSTSLSAWVQPDDPRGVSGLTLPPFGTHGAL